MPFRFIPFCFIVVRTYARLTLGVLISVLFFVPAATPGALAADHTWSGGGADDDWSTGGNWIGGAPDGNDRVIFDSNSAARLNNNNDLGAGALTGMRIRLVDPTGDVTITGHNISLAGADPTIDLSAAQKDLTININMTQIGDTYYDVAANRTLTIGGDVNGPGIFTKKGDGTLFSNGNNLLCATYNISGGTLKLGAANVLPAASAVEVGAGAVLELNDNNQTIGSLSGLGQVDLGSGDFIFGDANDTTFGGLIGGNANTGNVTKQGAGKVTLTGGERARFTTGTLSINAGTLQVDNFWVSISVAVAAGATLQGNGIIITPVGGVTINAGGNLAPGGSTGQLICEDGLTLAAGANFNVELNGTAVGTGYDQLIVDGSLDLGSSNLNLNLGFTPAEGDTFTIIDYLSLGAVNGTFNGLVEGATFVSGGTQFQITYAGGDGNDVVLTSQGAPTLAAQNPSSYNVTVTKVEMWNGSQWITIFAGAAQLNTVAGGTFPGISNRTLQEGTYSQLRTTFNNAFTISGTLNYAGTDYYTTAATFGGQTNLASTPTTVAGSMAAYTFYNPAWGALNADVMQTFAITPITVGAATDYQPTLRFTISNTLLLRGTAGNPATYFFSLAAPTGSLIEP